MNITDNDLTIIRIIVALAVLLGVCPINWKTLRAPNKCWLILGVFGLAANAYDFWQTGFSTDYLLWLVAEIVIVYVVMFLLFRFGVFGGAIAKALISLAIVFPTYPAFSLAGMDFPLNSNALLPVFAFSVLGNAIIFTLLLMLCLFIYNLFKWPLGEILAHPLDAFISHRISLDRVDTFRSRLRYYFMKDNDRLVWLTCKRKSSSEDEMLENIKIWYAEGLVSEKILVTPKLPFLVIITAGFIIAVRYGDILMQFISMLTGL
jgi:archaeal preflagellin peptidase FlaK